MRIDGHWYLCDDGAIRPVIGGKIQAADASFFAAEFLVDTGADRTVLAAATLQALRLPHVRVEERLEGVGGRMEAVVVETCIAFRDEQQQDILFRGRFAAAIDDATLDMCVLGRDILNLFALIVDRPRDVVCLLGQRHTYVISEG